MKPLTRWSAVLSLALIAGFAASCAKKAKEAPPTPPAPPPTPPPPPPAPEPTKVEFEPAFFDFDSYKLRDDARSVLGHDARVLRENGDVHVTIEGHCDERGTVEYNQALGEKRAQAARDYLVAAGIDASRIQTISYGKERPFAEGHDESAWQQNRRAHLVTR
ncbi:MAG: peptidoglycan-associated lipoprotein Pal [Candidatus Eisenbacteria bacterium]|uniref:Peptidoglycan-associated lipoprotein n=1 Tax=Eiseniibacteriota bacterium TaxID=2212470 RepID=A0A538SB51_UNCEI|nr:MAG: peptidoglycan-associated lipoprotein Pal [Candidatus Eisenbacteria bacterium]